MPPIILPPIILPAITLAAITLAVIALAAFIPAVITLAPIARRFDRPAQAVRTGRAAPEVSRPSV